MAARTEIKISSAKILVFASDFVGGGLAISRVLPGPGETLESSRFWKFFVVSCWGLGSLIEGGLELSSFDKLCR